MNEAFDQLCQEKKDDSMETTGLKLALGRPSIMSAQRRRT
jgi:hypothetical protein